MEVFVIPVGRDRYELYCETAPPEPDVAPDTPPTGIIGKLRHRFISLLRAAEERRHGVVTDEEPKGWIGRMQDRLMSWVAERIAEQRLLWNLRGESAVMAVHPQDMSFEQVSVLIKRVLQRDYERHRLWLIIDSVFLIGSALLTILPGPNLVAYYFLFRVGGHWLSMRGARQGIHRIVWSGRPCEPLAELRDVVTLEPGVRDQRVNEIATRLRLQHLATFFERVAVRHA